jgi:hypothetical protein
MAVHIGHARPIAVVAAVGAAAIITGAAAVIGRTAPVIGRSTAVIVVVGLPVLGLGRGDRNSGADDAGKSRGAAAPPPPGKPLRRALMSVAPLVPEAALRPFAAGAEPARASDGATAVSAIAATLTMAAVRPIDENTPFRTNIAISSVVTRPLGL